MPAYIESGADPWPRQENNSSVILIRCGKYCLEKQLQKQVLDENVSYKLTFQNAKHSLAMGNR